MIQRISLGPINQPADRSCVQLQHWLEQARAGSNLALGYLLEDCRSYLLLVARDAMGQSLRPKFDPDDVVQDTALEALQSFGAFDGQSHAQFVAWLRRILLNNAADSRRRYQATHKRRAGLERTLDAAGMVTPVDPRATPEEQAVTRELHE